MALPEHTAALLYAGGSWRLPGADDQACEGARFHSPTPLFVEDTRIVPVMWLSDLKINPGVAPECVWLCGTCRDNLAILTQIYKAAEGRVPWKVRREFGNSLRALAERGWARYEQVTGGRRA